MLNVATEVSCPTCQKTNAGKLIYCVRCTAELRPGRRKDCANCQTKIPGSAAFCPECGRPTADTPEPADCR